MNSKEKVRKAVSFEESEIPIDFGANPVTGIHCSVVEKLREYYGLETRPVKITCPYQLLGMIEEDLKSAMGIDTDHIWSPYNMYGTYQGNWKEWKTPWGQEVLISGDLVIKSDEKGDCFVYPQGDDTYPPSGHMPSDSFFFDATNRQKEFVEENLDWRDNTEEFTPVTTDELEYYRTAKSTLQKETWIAGSFGGTAIGDVSLVPATQLKDPKGIRDVEEWYASMLLRQDYLHNIFAYQTEIAIENLKKIAEILADDVDSAYICGADFGTQKGPICSPALYKKLYLPYHKKINDWIHEYTQWKTFKHSCGGVELFINAFIEAGFDILNPIQWTAAGMDRETIKTKYAQKIVFWGGGVDTQKTLPFGSPKDVEKEVLETCKIFGKGGGFVFSSIHNIQALTPVENIIAMLEAVKTYNKG